MRGLILVVKFVVGAVLLLTGALYLKMDHCEVVSTKISHNQYNFNLPMSFSRAVQYFDLDSVSRRTALRYDNRGWLKVKVVQNYMDQSINDSNKLLISGVNFYFDDSLSRNKAMQKLELIHKKPFEFDKIIDYHGNVTGWKSLELNCRVTILSYRFNPTFNTMGEEIYGIQAKNKQYVLAFVFNQPPKFQLAQYVELDGLASIP